MIYLDNAATTFPKPPTVTEAVARAMTEYGGNPGRSAHALSVRTSELIYDCRRALADFFHADAPENVVFTYNATYALNLAIKALLIPGSHILISDCEHNAVLRPIAECTRRGLCTFDRFRTEGRDDDILNAIARVAKPDTAMIVCTQASNIGARFPPIERIGKLCRFKDWRFIVDGSQGAGILETDMQKIHADAYCAPGHKGLYGPMGTGFVIFRDGVVGNTVTEGGTGIHSMETEMPSFLPERYEAGTLGVPGIAGLSEGLCFVKENRFAIRRNEERLYRELLSELRKIGGITVYPMSDKAGNTLSFNVDGISPADVAEALDDRGIAVRAGLHCAPDAHRTIGTEKTGTVRVGFGCFNRSEDVARLLDALEKIKKAAR